MQTIWSRAAQAHVCSCQSCLHAANSVARRASVAGARRRITFTDAFTACYTTILGTAAVIDAQRKDQRRQDLDRRIEQARTGLARVAEESQSLTISSHAQRLSLDPDILALERPLEVIESLRMICLPFHDLAKQHKNAEGRRRSLGNLHKVYFPDRDFEATLGAMKGVNLKALEAALGVEESQVFNHREALTATQFSKSIEATNELVEKLISEAYRQEHSGDLDAAQRSLQSLDSAWTAIRMLRSEGYPRYNHPELDPARARKYRHDLNTSTRAIFASWQEDLDRSKKGISRWDPRRVKFLVTKICYNFLISPVPPSIHNYNALLSGFTRLGEHSLGKVVAKHLLKSTPLHPTQLTLVCLLHHYRATNDIRGFYRIIRRLIGLDVRGMHIRRRLVKDVTIQPDLKRWIWRSDVARRGPYYVQRAHRDDALYEAIIKGLLHFDRVVDASRVFVACMRERCSITTQTLTQLLNQCLYTLDQVAARVIVRGLISHANWAGALLLKEDSPRKLADGIYSIFHLSSDYLQHKSLTLPALKHGLKTAVGAASFDRRALRDLDQLSVALLIKDYGNQLHRLGYIIRRIERRMGDYSLSLLDTASSALRELRWLDIHYQSLAKDRRKYSRMMQINTIAEELWRVERDVKRSEFRFINILSNALPSRSRYRAALQNRSIPLEKRVRRYKAALKHDGLEIKVDRALTAHESGQEALKFTLLRFLEDHRREALLLEHKHLANIPLESILEARSQQPAGHADSEGVNSLLDGEPEGPTTNGWLSHPENNIPDFRARTPMAADFIRNGWAVKYS